MSAEKRERGDAMEYKATAKLEDGTVETFEGSIQQCAEWADGIMSGKGATAVTISRSDGE